LRVVQIIHLEDARLDAGAEDEKAVAVAAVLVAVRLANRAQRVLDRDALEIERDRALHVRMHDHAVARALDELREHLPRRRAGHGDIETRIHRDAAAVRARHAERRQQCIAHLLRQRGRRRIVRRLTQCLIGAFGGLALPEIRVHGLTRAKQRGDRCPRQRARDR